MGPSKAPTRRDLMRFQQLQELGCIVIRVFFPKLLWRFGSSPGDIHHVLVGGRRQRDPHQKTICLLPWYHRGVPLQVRRRGKVVQLTATETKQRLGPSMALDRAAFEARFESDQVLLAWTDELLAKYRETLIDANPQLPKFDYHA